MEFNDDNHTHIDPVKTGSFIRELRKSHNWTQDELGEKLFISRKSVSKWETGKCCPSIDMLKRLSETLGVSFDDLIAGEFPIVEEETLSAIEKIINNKKVRITWKIVVTSLFFLLLLFFIYNYNTTKVYKLSYEDENFTIDNGVIVISKAKNYINLGDFYANFPDITKDTKFEFVLYMYDGSNKHELLRQENNKTTTSIKDASNEFLTKNIKDNMNNTFLNIKFVNIYDELKEYDLKLKVNLDFMNNFKYFFDYNETSEVIEEQIPMAFSRSIQMDGMNREFDLTFLYENFDKLKKLDKSTLIVDDVKYEVISESNSVKIANGDISISIMLDVRKITIKHNVTTVISINDNNVFVLESSLINYIELFEIIINFLESKI